MEAGQPQPPSGRSPSLTPKDKSPLSPADKIVQSIELLHGVYSQSSDQKVILGAQERRETNQRKVAGKMESHTP
jgi:hypothetical protein